MNRKLIFECGCHFHKIEIEEFDITKFGSFISICIYEHKSGKTGKLLKKPKLIADAMLHPEQVKLFKSAFKNE